MSGPADSSAERAQTFDAWIAAHGAIVLRTARAFARGADRDDLEQELLLAVWRAIPAYRGDASVATFLYRVAHNAALTWRRAERGRGERELRVVDELARQGTAGYSAGLAGDELAGDEARRLEQAYEAIRELPALDRALVLLSLDGISYAEMAAIHGLSVNHVGVRLSRARRLLASRLEGDSQ